MSRSRCDLRGGGVGGDHHHGDVAGPRIGLQSVEQLRARHVGEVEVEEHEMGAVLACQLEPQAPRHRGEELDYS